MPDRLAQNMNAPLPPTPPSSEIRQELAELLFTTALPAAIIGISTIGLALTIMVQTGNLSYAAVAIAAAFVTAYRVGCVFAFRKRSAGFAVATFERFYAAGAIGFSLVLAAFSAVAFAEPVGAGHLMAAVLVASYCAGIVVRASARPWIAISTVLVAAVPLAAVSAMKGTPEFVAVGIAIVLVIVGSIDTVFHTYRITHKQLTTRRRFADLSALDSLTGLPNRSMLYQRLDALFARVNGGLIAIHFIDLDHFKDINDSYGHATGDSILEEVARRLRAILVKGSFAARVGGDEFVLVQTNIIEESAARQLADRIVEAIRQPIALPHTTLVVETSNGCQLVEPGTVHWRDVLAAADEALYEAKRNGRGHAVLKTSSANSVQK